MRILIAGGGTGGHFYPALAVIEELIERRSGAKLAYIGTRRGIEARVLKEHPQVLFHAIKARGLKPGRPFSNIIALAYVALAVMQSAAFIIGFRPQVIIGMGGYASFAPILTGIILGRIIPIRTVLHEQNVIAGLANRILSRFVDRIFVSYEETALELGRRDRTVVTGNPIRKEFLLARRNESLYRKLGLDPDRRTVLVFGGSNGSATLNKAVLRAQSVMSQSRDVQVLLIVGNTDDGPAIKESLLKAGAGNVVVHRYIEKMGEAFAVADLIVCRAGATTIAEITSCGKPAILIPWQDAANGHQEANARILARENACRFVKEKDIQPLGLVTLIRRMLDDENLLEEMAGNSLRMGRRRATSTVLDEILALAREAHV